MPLQKDAETARIVVLPVVVPDADLDALQAELCRIVAAKRALLARERSILALVRWKIRKATGL